MHFKLFYYFYINRNTRKNMKRDEEREEEIILVSYIFLKFEGEKNVTREPNGQSRMDNPETLYFDLEHA
jgi:hypothetical protein